MISIEDYTSNTLVIKKSEFVCHLIPCSQIEQANDMITKYSEPQATHNCVAYIIGPHERAYDDGEPSGTAGMPMIKVLKMQGLTNMLAIVNKKCRGNKLCDGGLT